jgi:hypothetical protein
MRCPSLSPPDLCRVLTTLTHPGCPRLARHPTHSAVPAGRAVRHGCSARYLHISRLVLINFLSHSTIEYCSLPSFSSGPPAIQSTAPNHGIRGAAVQRAASPEPLVPPRQHKWQPLIVAGSLRRVRAHSMYALTAEADHRGTGKERGARDARAGRLALGVDTKRAGPALGTAGATHPVGENPKKSKEPFVSRLVTPTTARPP